MSGPRPGEGTEWAVDLDRTSIGARIRGLLAEADNGHVAGASIFVEGVPGIGKTHLVREVVQGARRRGMRCLLGEGQALRRLDGLALLDQWLTAGRPSEDRSDPPADVPAESAPETIDPVESAMEAVEGLCDESTVLLVVDDAHHLDSASLGLLRRLTWTVRRLPIVLLVAARPAPGRTQLADIARQVTLGVRLPPLGQDELHRLVTARLGHPPGPRLVRELGRAGGNPQFALEMLAALQRSGRLAPAGETADLSPGAVAGWSTVEEVVRDHLYQLDEAVVEVISALAVFGGPAALDDLGQVMFLEPGNLQGCLDRAAGAGVVVERPGGTVDLTCPLYRDVAGAELSASERRAVHRRIAAVLTRRTAPAAVVAGHLAGGAEISTGPGSNAAIEALRKAAEAAAKFAPAVSAELLETAGRLAAPGDSRMDQLALARAETLFLAGHNDRAAAAAAQRLTSTTDPATAMGLGAVLIRSLVNAGRVEAATTAITATLDDPYLPAAVSRQLEQLRCFLLVQDGRLDAASARTARLLPLFAAQRDDIATAGLLVSAALIDYLRARPDDALANLRRYQGIVEIAGEPVEGRFSATVWLPLMELASRGPAAAVAAAMNSRRPIAGRRPTRWLDQYHSFVDGGIAVVAGQWDDAIVSYDTGLEMAEETGSGWTSIAVGQRAYLAVHRGELSEAQERINRFRLDGRPLQFGADYLGLAEMVLLAAGGSATAAAVLARQLWRAAPTAGEWWMLQLAPDATRCLLMATEISAAQRVCQDVGAIDVGQVAVLAFVPDLVAGMVEADPVRLTRAAEQAQEIGNGQLAAFAWEELAAALAATSPNRCRAAARRALSAYDDWQAVTDRDRLLSRLRDRGVRLQPGRRPPAGVTTVDGLTWTERRVARLIRDGLSNPQIAEQLCISPRTVQTHVSHILAKWGLRSRVEVATAVARDATGA